MLTKNGYALMFGLMNKAETIMMKNMDGRTLNVDLSSSGYANNSNFDAFAYFESNWSSNKPAKAALYFGSGDTPPSVNDYTFGGESLAGVICEHAKAAVNIGDEYSEIQVTVVAKNNYDESITIKEVCLFGVLNQNNSNTSKVFLMDRTVLATPITISPGGSKSFTYNLRHTY